jgi:UPF0716 protein FxsA
LWWWLLAAVFVLLPIAEIWLIIQLGHAIGAWWTVLVLVADAALGSYLVRLEGSRAWRALQEALASHRMPARELADGALILVGGTLLMLPGFISDVFGFFCILPFTRPFARRILAAVISRRLTAVMVPPGGSPAGSRGRTATRPDHEDVVRGEVVDEDR